MPKRSLKSLSAAFFVFSPLALSTVSAFADSVQATEKNSENKSAVPQPVSTVETPAPYRYLDWWSPEVLEALPAEQRPVIEGTCEGMYIAPLISTQNGNEAPKDAPIEATADRYETNSDGSITLTGKVIIQQGNRQLESDTITIHQESRETQMMGNVRIRQEGMLMTGEKASLNLNSKDLSLVDAEYVVHESRIRGTATHIHNEDENTLIFDKSSYTTCEPGSNAWQFEASDIRLNKESGWGTAKHAVIRVKDVPVFYFPWLMFPIDDRRQTGFLFPSFGSGEENGTQIALPYYLNLAPNYDATLTPRHMSERGTQLEGEFRYLTEYGEGELGGAYLPNDKSFDEQTRDLFLWRHNGYFVENWYARADYTEVSDDDYFKDLETSLNAKSQSHLQQMAEVGYTGANWSAYGKVEHYQTLDELIDDANLPYRKEPQLRLTGDWGLGDSPFRFLWKSGATRFEHPEDDFNGIVEAERFTVSPGMEYQYRKPWAFVTPRIRIIHSDYNFTSNTAGESLNEDQTLYTASLDAQLFLERSVSFGDNEYTQTLEPRVFYLYTPYEEQNHRQVFDTGRLTFDYSQLFRENRFTGDDRYGDANQVSLGVTTRFIDDETGWERFRASMGQIFYLDDRRVQLNDTIDPETDERSAWVGLAEWRLNEDWRLRSDMQWDEIRNNIDRATASANYLSTENGILNLSYRYIDEGAATNSTAEKIKQTDLSFVYPVNQNWSIMGRWGYDMTFARSFENLVGIEYDSCCWKLRLVNRRYLEEDNNDPTTVEPQRGIFLQFQLKGLGGVGNELDSILIESIGGFEDRERQKTETY